MTDFTKALLEELAHVGDPEVDEVIKEHVERADTSDIRTLVRDVGRSLELPSEKRSPVIEAYLHERPPLPPWKDATLLDRGARFFELRGLEIGSALLPGLAARGLRGRSGARVLRLTARLVSDTVRHVNETAQMVFDTMERDGLDPSTGQGYQDIRRVRLMHGAVRYLILNDDEVVKTKAPAPGKTWCTTDGVPLNQADLLGALMTFTIVPLDVLNKLGIGYRADDGAAYMHTWSVAGHLMGIRPDLLPISEPDARDLTELIRDMEQERSDDGVVLTNALLEAMENSIRWRAARGLPSAVMRFYVGERVAAIVGQSKAPRIELFFRPLRRLLSVIGLVQQENRLLNNITRHVTGAILRQFMDANREGRPQFQLPPSLQTRLMDAEKRWHL